MITNLYAVADCIKVRVTDIKGKVLAEGLLSNTYDLYLKTEAEVIACIKGLTVVECVKGRDYTVE